MGGDVLGSLVLRVVDGDELKALRGIFVVQLFQPRQVTLGDGAGGVHEHQGIALGLAQVAQAAGHAANVFEREIAGLAADLGRLRLVAARHCKPRAATNNRIAVMLTLST